MAGGSGKVDHSLDKAEAVNVSDPERA